MAEVPMRELRNHGGDVIDRVTAGEHVIVTRAGRPVAELRSLRRPTLSAATLLERWSPLPRVDPRALRSDIDAVFEASL